MVQIDDLMAIKEKKTKNSVVRGRVKISICGYSINNYRESRAGLETRVRAPMDEFKNLFFVYCAHNMYYFGTQLKWRI